MRAGLRHLIRENLQDIVEGSYLNCHVKGVHSLMLLDYPNKSIRLFYASPEHELYKNASVALEHNTNGMPMSAAFHPHRRNLTLYCLKGKIYNVAAMEWPSAYKYCSLDKYLYTSKILEDQMTFKKVEADCKVVVKSPTSLNVDDDIYLRSDDIHTIVADQGKACAWLVFEGNEDPSYINYCYSNCDLENVSEEGMYLKPNENQVRDILASVELL